MQVQICLSSQYSPQVWKSSERSPEDSLYSAWVFWYWLVEKSGPQCMVEAKLSGPPEGYPTLPLLSMMSISPLAGQLEYSLYRGSIQIAGHSQFPLGSFALTSTLPYLMERDSMVVSLPLMTGLMKWFPSDLLSQPQKLLAVQQSAGAPPHMLQVNPFLTFSAPILSSVRMGLMLSLESFTKVVERLLSQSSNSQLPPPDMVMSCFHFLKSKELNSSSKISFVQLRQTIVRRIKSVAKEYLLISSIINIYQIGNPIIFCLRSQLMRQILQFKHPKLFVDKYFKSFHCLFTNFLKFVNQNTPQGAMSESESATQQQTVNKTESVNEAEGALKQSQITPEQKLAFDMEEKKVQQKLSELQQQQKQQASSDPQEGEQCNSPDQKNKSSQISSEISNPNSTTQEAMELNETKFFVDINRNNVAFGKTTLYPGSIEEVDVVIGLKDELIEDNGGNHQFMLRIIAKCNNAEFNDLEEYVFSVRSNERFEYFEEVRFKIRRKERAQVKVAVKIPPVKQNCMIQGVLEVQLENLEPVCLPIVSKCEIPEILCIKDLYKPDEDTQLIKVPAKKNQIRMPPIPFKNLSAFSFTLEVEAISSESFQDKPYDIITQNFVNCQANTQFFVNIQLKENMNYKGPMPSRDTIRKILVLKIKNTSVFYNYPLQVFVFESSQGGNNPG